MTMTLYEGLILTNLAVSLWLAYNLGKAKTEIEILYQGIAQVMSEEDES